MAMTCGYLLVIQQFALENNHFLAKSSTQQAICTMAMSDHRRVTPSSNPKMPQPWVPQLIVGLALVLLLNSSWVIALMIVVGEPQRRMGCGGLVFGSQRMFDLGGSASLKSLFTSQKMKRSGQHGPCLDVHPPTCSCFLECPLVN